MLEVSTFKNVYVELYTEIQKILEPVAISTIFKIFYNHIFREFFFKHSIL